MDADPAAAPMRGTITELEREEGILCYSDLCEEIRVHDTSWLAHDMAERVI